MSNIIYDIPYRVAILKKKCESNEDIYSALIDYINENNAYIYKKTQSYYFDFLANFELLFIHENKIYIFLYNYNLVKKLHVKVFVTDLYNKRVTNVITDVSKTYYRVYNEPDRSISIKDLKIICRITEQ